MEFKVIFAGFALHCVLNAVLIGKSVITDSVESKSSAAHAEIVQEQERVMLRELASGTSEMGRITEDPSDAKRLEVQR